MAHLKIVVLEITALNATRNAYPLRYYSEEEGGAQWATEPLAEEWIPADLPDATNRDWTAAKVLDRVENDNGASPAFQQIGEYLAGLLEIGKVGQRWKARRKLSHGLGMKMRTVLRIGPKELRPLPWEMMYAGNKWLFRDAGNPMYRGVDATNPIPFESLPLRVLVVVGARDKEREDIHWDTELEELRRKLHRNTAVELEELIRPSAQQVITFVEQFRPHVFHFIGHGEMVGNPKEPALVLWDAEQVTNRHWKGDLMRQDFSMARWTPHMILFNACRSAAAQENTNELARVLIEDGACCVIGMQGDVRGKASAVFAENVYNAILKGLALDVAVAEARVAVSNTFSETRDWALPALYVACSPHEAMPTTFRRDAQAVLNQFTNAYIELSEFVDRQDERRELCWIFLNEQQPLQQQNLIILHGTQGIGKSDLVRWCSRHLSLRGRNVHYVDLLKNGGETRTILEAIRKGRKRATGSILGPLPAEPFAVFDRKLEALERGQPEGGSEPTQQLCDTFMDGLKVLASNDEWVIILDHFELKTAGISGTVDPKDFTDYLKPSLFDPISDGAVGKLKLLLVMRDEELRRDEGRKLAGQARIVPIMAWEADKFEWLARQFVIDALAKRRADVETLMTIYKTSNIVGAWGPAHLRKFGEILSLVL